MIDAERCTARAGFLAATFICLSAAVSLLAPRAQAETVDIAASKDNTLYSESDSLSNGSGQHFFAGRVGTGGIRRGPVAFDVASSIPPGSTITSARLTLNVSRTLALVGAQPVSLHRVLDDWGEGTSDADGIQGEGGGAPATPGDATWVHRFFDTAFWGTPGGDFEASPSATILVADLGSYTWDSTPGMVADVQAWLDEPARSFGWILVGNEAAFPTSKRFDSSENPTLSLRPLLSVEFTPPADLAGQVPDGRRVPGEPLTIARQPDGRLTLRWGASCLSSDRDYEVYEGVLGDFRSHAPSACSTGGATSFTLAPPAGSAYYLVVPRNAGREGSYGADSRNGSRPPSLSACLPQAVLVCQ